MNLLQRLMSSGERATGLVKIFPTWAATSNEIASGSRTAFMASPIVHSLIMARTKVFSEVRFGFRRFRTGEIFGTGGLELLERPWPGGTTSELLARMEQDVSLSGNSYVVRATTQKGDPQLQVLNPELVEVLTDDKQKSGYLYWPNGLNSGDPQPLLLENVAHWAPIPHPNKNFVGAAWVDAVIPEIRNDLAMVTHHRKFFENAATPNLFVKVKGAMTDEGRDRLKTELDRRYQGLNQAWKTLVLDNDADAKVIGASFEQMDFVNMQNSGEARIAAAAGVPPILVSFQAGLAAATYSNYGLAMRAFADHTIRPQWNSVAAALGQIIPAPPGSQLWYDDRHVAALQQDALDTAEIDSKRALTLESLIRGGYTPESARDAVLTGDFAALEHTGLFSVQLQPPMSDQQAESEQVAGRAIKMILAAAGFSDALRLPAPDADVEQPKDSE